MLRGMIDSSKYAPNGEGIFSTPDNLLDIYMTSHAPTALIFKYLARSLGDSLREGHRRLIIVQTPVSHEVGHAMPLRSCQVK